MPVRLSAHLLSTHTLTRTLNPSVQCDPLVCLLHTQARHRPGWGRLCLCSSGRGSQPPPTRRLMRRPSLWAPPAHQLPGSCCQRPPACPQPCLRCRQRLGSWLTGCGGCSAAPRMPPWPVRVTAPRRRWARDGGQGQPGRAAQEARPVLRGRRQQAPCTGRPRQWQGQTCWEAGRGLRPWAAATAPRGARPARCSASSGAPPLAAYPARRLVTGPELSQAVLARMLAAQHLVLHEARVAVRPWPCSWLGAPHPDRTAKILLLAWRPASRCPVHPAPRRVLSGCLPSLSAGALPARRHALATQANLPATGRVAEADGS